MASSWRGAVSHLVASSAVLLLVFAAALLTVCDGGRFWQDDCHVEVSTCTDEGDDPCLALSAVSTPRAEVNVAILPLACALPACASSHVPLTLPTFEAPPLPRRPFCHVFTRVRSPRAPPLVLAV